MLDSIKKYGKLLLVAALTLEARAVVRRYKPRIVAVTGSVGKTSTKDAIFTVLAAQGRTRKSHKSFNSEVGLPLTILGRPNAWNNPLRWAQNLLDGLFLAVFPTNYPQWLVLEVGADRPGDIQRVARWMPVEIAVITRLPEIPVHVEFFSSPEEVVKEKASLIGGLRNLPAGKSGTLVLYADDARATEFRALAPEGARVVTFGLSEHADVRAQNPELLIGAHGEPLGMKATLHIGADSAPLELCGALGVHSMLPMLAAAAAGHAIGMTLSDIAKALRQYEPPAGRMHLVPGRNGSSIIDDTYNSSPAATEAALEALGQLRGGRRIAALGDMLELGRHSVDEHRKIGAAAAANADMLFLVGVRARDIAQGALSAGMSQDAVLEFEDSRAVGEELADTLKAGDCALVKGSQGMRMERAVAAAMAHPERAKELLVRQEKEWRRR